VHFCQYTSAWSLLQLHRSRKANCIQEAKKRAVRAMKILSNHRKVVETHLAENERETIRQRECDIARLLAEIHGIIGEKKEAEENLQLALSLTTSTEIQIELMNVKYAFDWSDKVEVAQRLDELSNTSTGKIEAQLKTAVAHFEKESIDDAIAALRGIQHRFAHKNRSNAACKKMWGEMAVFAYKVRDVKKRFKVCEEEGNREGQCKCEEQLGDLFADADYNERAIVHYGEALNLASSYDEKKAAFTSLAVTAWEMKKYAESIEYYVQLKEVQKKAGVSTMDTDVEMFKTKLGGDLFMTDEEILKEVKGLIPANKSMCSIYEWVAVYYENRGQKEQSDKFRSLERLCKPMENSDSNKKATNKDSEKSNYIKFDDMNDKQILRKFEEECRASRAQITRTSHQKFEVSRESKLMKAVRKGNMKQLRELVEKGDDIDEASAVGRTALSDAVGMQREDMVDFLLEKGAEVNCVSEKGADTNSLKGWKQSNFGGGLTPLHEACFIGNVSIAKKLLSAGADVTMDNVDEWRALDFLKFFIERSSIGLDANHLSECISLSESLQEMEKNAGFIRTVDPAYPKRTEYKPLQEIVEKKKRGRPFKVDNAEGVSTAVKRPRGRGAAGTPELNDEAMNEGMEEDNDELNGLNDIPYLDDYSMANNDYALNLRVMENNQGDYADDTFEESNWGIRVKTEEEREEKEREGQKDTGELMNDEKENEQNCEIKMDPGLLESIKEEAWDETFMNSNDNTMMSANTLSAGTSAGSETILLRVSIFDGEVQRKRVLVEASGGTRVGDLIFHSHFKKHIEHNEQLEWTYDGDEIDSVTIASLSGITMQRPIDVMCTVKK
ncbi:hypothetical protein PFISCL1PPCAC_11394, partial [Pristionchus fissidentatus]